jgi:hypothetical protein
MRMISLLVAMTILGGCKTTNVSSGLRSDDASGSSVTYQCNGQGAFTIDSATRDRVAGYSGNPRPIGPMPYAMQYAATPDAAPVTVQAISEWHPVAPDRSARRMHVIAESDDGQMLSGFMAKPGTWLGYAFDGANWAPMKCLEVQGSGPQVTYQCSGDGGASLSFNLDRTTRDRVAGYGGYSQPDGPQDYVLTAANKTFKARALWAPTAPSDQRMQVTVEGPGGLSFTGFMSQQGTWDGYGSVNGVWQPMSCSGT